MDYVELKVYYTVSGDEEDAFTPACCKMVAPVISDIILYNEREPVRVVVMDAEENIIGFLDLRDVKVTIKETLEGESTLTLEKPLNTDEDTL